ncbi:MAG: PTS fructose transporter subunit IIA [Deltaproteobacteria bacterium]|nr:PTS fructose transporter subunit IIA [Deltaproteobacteria bacterium]
MVGILLITHGHFAEVLISTAEAIVGQIENIRAVSVSAEDDVETIKGIISGMMEEVDQGDGVIMLTDMFGGTPSNIGLSFLSHGEVEIITGVNLPILLKLAKERGGKTLPDLASLLKKRGRESIVLASEMLNGKS